MKGKTYADYIATRPNVEMQGTHGLFSTNDEPIVLSRVSEELNAHEGNIWTMIVSLRREDAQRLGYEKAYLWRDMLRSHTEEIANALKIPITNLKWYAAFHNESHHPHIHLIAYSTDTQRGYLTKAGVNQLRSALANDIFKDELQHIYAEQTRLRDELKIDWKAMLQGIMDKVSNGNYENKEIEEKLLRLAKRLDVMKTKSSYRTLPLIPQIAEELMKEKARQERMKGLLRGSYCKEYQEYICVDATGKIIKPTYVSEHFGVILRQHQMPKIKFHDLRHSCASLLLSNGVPIKMIQDWLGHSDMGTTANIYSHIDAASKLMSANVMSSTIKI